MALLANLSIPWGTKALLGFADSANLTAPTPPWLEDGQSQAPLCTLCCCGLLNRTLAVVFMVSLAFAIVVGNVVTLTVFMQTRQSRTPQGYLKGKGAPTHSDTKGMAKSNLRVTAINLAMLLFLFVSHYNADIWE